MSESKNAANNHLKKQSTVYKEKTISHKIHGETKKSKNNQFISSRKGQEAIDSNRIPLKSKNNDININKLNENRILVPNSPHHKRNHSQLDVSSGFFNIQSSKNDNEFEKQIQNNQTNLSPGVTIGRDGKTPVNPTFVIKKYKDMLTKYELTEINNYPDVYFVGNSISRKITKGSFDDEKTSHYKARVGDHIAYRYEILSILGKGVFGTVVKCLDHKTKEKVAIKILIDTYTMDQQGKIEIENLKLLESDNLFPNICSKKLHPNTNSPIKQISSKSKRSSSIEIPQLNPNNDDNQQDQVESTKSNPNLKHVVEMIDHFYFRKHICIVTEILGESLRDYMVRRTMSKPLHLQGNQNVDPNNLHLMNTLDPLPPQMVKCIAYQIMEGLSCIHKKKIIHGDLKPENILFTNPAPSKNNNESASKNKISSNSRQNTDLFNLNFQPPQKITSHFTISFSAIDNFTLMSQVKIIDFGSSSKQGESIFNYIQSRYYRSPEIILGSSYGTAIDVWSAGCIIAELFVGKPLFPAVNDTDLLYRFIETLGAPPESVIKMKADFQSKLLKKSKISPLQNRFFGDDGRLLNVNKQPVPLRTRLTSFLQSSDTMMIDFLTKCLEWDKSKRLSASKLLKHPWIAEFAKKKI